MREKDLLHLPAEDGGGHALTSETTRRKLTAISARVGVWAVIGGLGGVILGDLAPSLAMVVAGTGFLAGGLGAMATSLLVLKDARRASWPLRLAAAVGLPFGACLSLFSLGILWGVSFPGALMSVAAPAGLILGVILMVLLLTGFISHALSGGSGTEWEE